MNVRVRLGGSLTRGWDGASVTTAWHRRRRDAHWKLLWWCQWAWDVKAWVVAVMVALRGGAAGTEAAEALSGPELGGPRAPDLGGGGGFPI
ncbi:hypothetical protein Pmani_031924 [Petrolisthes manimaculis]|uniref:Uncharacterized protein n=1 Tax=Petrolisthes manimaculis TaxID=1843537 RepID=A0AAE1NUP7_9EUCA|nr:hypothetical protein Pmani_031924 [Petrolisthes manimaculis]